MQNHVAKIFISYLEMLHIVIFFVCFIVGIVMQYISKKTETIIVVRCLRIATQICNTPNNCPSKIIPKMK